MHRGYIKLYRRLTEWEWYTDIPVRILFEHCLLKANHKDKKWKGELVCRGSFITSYEKLAIETGLSIRQVRTALDKLKTTNEVTHEGHTQYSIITVKNWDLFQEDDKQNDNQMTNERQTSDKRATTTNNVKNEKNKEKEKIKKEKESFDFFWKLYPRKKSKDTAFKAYQKAILAVEPSAIIDGLQKYLAEIKVKNTQAEYIKHPATWLNQKCWEDEYITSYQPQYAPPDPMLHNSRL